MKSHHSAENRLKLLRVARESLEHFLNNGQRTKFTTETPELQTKRAVFVTLRKEIPEIYADVSGSQNRATL